MLVEDAAAADLQAQRCKVCWSASGFDFHVPDRVWWAVVPINLQNHVVCLRCFDRFANDRDIDYSTHIEGLWFAGEMAAFHFIKEK